jgi:RNA polymerase sigma-70 factor (ECF subfamily)
MVQPGSHLRPVPAGGAPDRSGPAANASAASAAEQTLELVQRAQAGQMSAWSKLYQDNFERIYRHVRALTGDPHVSEELVQETFVQALLRISSFDRRSTFGTWLHGVAINVVRNHWRSQKSTAKAHAKLEVVRSMDAPGDEPGVTVHRQQRVKALYAALETLPDPLRVAFVLRDLEGLSPEEAAHRLEITPGNLAVRATRARQRIRKQLIAWGVLADDTAEAGS